jgi:phosphoribosylformylglycinamidine cyclo-ligase
VVPQVFDFIQRTGAISHDEMFRAFNMGVGLVAICDPADADHVLAMLMEAGERGATQVGVIEAGEKSVRYQS